jgi:SLOG cluster2/TIR domain
MPGITTAGEWPLAVHVVYDDAVSAGPQAAPAGEFIANLTATLQAQLSHGDRAARVPVRFWRSQVRDGIRRLPANVPLAQASKNLVLVVVDRTLFDHRAEWEAWIDALVGAVREGRDLILPLAVQADAGRVAKAFADVNHIEVKDPRDAVREGRIVRAVCTSLLTLLVPELPHVFLCHAKADGEGIAQTVRSDIQNRSQLHCFFDRHDIPHGRSVRASIEAAIGKSVMLVVWTDRLLDSPWCQMEIIEARRQQRPMLVLDALASSTPRLFPFLGNMPVVRWRDDPGPVLSAILLELVRAHHLAAIFEARTTGATDAPTFCLHPPDVLDTSLGRTRPPASPRAPQSSPLWIYPDPPLRSDELQILRQVIADKRFISLVEWQALRAAGALDAGWDTAVNLRPEPLRGLRIGISVSASDTWSDMGLTPSHQDDLSSQIALQLILLGAKVVWGGDLRPQGLGVQLRAIVEAYQHPRRAPQDHVALVVPFTLVPDAILKPEDIEIRRAFAEVRLMHPPADIATPAPDPKSDEGRALAAVALSQMRAELGGECDARILLGGGLKKFTGIYPGIAEEALETVRHERPLYVLGGFGGAADAVYDALSDPASAGAAALVRASHEVGGAASPGARRVHASLIEAAGTPSQSFAPEAMTAAFAALGTAGLARHNGLSMEENALLSRSQDLHEILDLVVKGIVACCFNRFAS